MTPLSLPDMGTLAQGADARPAPAIQPQRTPLETWASMTLDQKRPYHERWAESIEQYVMEGRAPSVELQPVFRRFREFLKRVYTSLKDFLAGRSATPGGQSAGAFDQTAVRAEPTGKVSPITRKPIMELFGEDGQRIGLTHSYATPEEALEKFNAPKSAAPPAPTVTVPSDDAAKTAAYLASREPTAEERAASDAARRALIAQGKLPARSRSATPQESPECQP